MTTQLKKTYAGANRPIRPSRVTVGKKIEHHLIALWLIVMGLIGFRLFEFYEGNNHAGKVNSVLWKLKKGQAEILEYLEYQDKYDDED